MELKAAPRTTQEKLADGMIPAVAYNKENNVSFTIDLKAFDRAFRTQGTSGLFDISIDGGQSFPALVKSVQMDKRRRVPQHVDFYMVTYGQPVEASVPVHVTGKSQGEVMGGLVDVVLHSVSIIAPGPRRIPHEITVDVTKLNIGDHVTAGDLKLPEGVKLAMDPAITVISVLTPRLSAEESPAKPRLPRWPAWWRPANSAKPRPSRCWKARRAWMTCSTAARPRPATPRKTPDSNAGLLTSRRKARPRSGPRFSSARVHVQAIGPQRLSTPSIKKLSVRRISSASERSVP